jgi:hypothetical protein
MAELVGFVCPLVADEFDETVALLKNDWTYELKNPHKIKNLFSNDFQSNLIALVKSRKILLECGCIS